MLCSVTWRHHAQKKKRAILLADHKLSTTKSASFYMGTFLLLLLLLHTCKTTTGSDVGDVRSSSAGCCWPVPAADGCFSGGKVSVAIGWTNPTLCWPTVRTGPWIINESETTNISGHICDWNEELRKEKVWINNWLENTLVDWCIHKRKCLFLKFVVASCFDAVLGYHCLDELRVPGWFI